MIDERQSLEAAEKVSLSDLATYLRSTGWKAQPSKITTHSIFSIDLPGADETIQVLLPDVAGSEDERKRIADALQTIAASEEREIPEIVQAIETKDEVRSSGTRTDTTKKQLRGTHPISVLEGMTASSASKLKSLGIRTTDGLLEAARTVKGRKMLAAKTGISEQQLLEWANICDYMRIPGMGKASAGLLRAAGVMTVRELALRNPARLAKAFAEVNKTRKLVRVIPDEENIIELIWRAKTSPSKVEQ
jgi:predicted RecB family nuclease